MKSVIVLMITGFSFGCVQSGREVINEAAVKRGDTIIDPVVPSHFEIDYNPVVKVSPNVFPQGSNGIGAIRIFIDTASRVARFEIISTRINDDGNIIYNYVSDKDSAKTQELINALKILVNSIKVRKLGNPILHGLEPYDLAVKFE